MEFWLHLDRCGNTWSEGAQVQEGEGSRFEINHPDILFPNGP
jgi:hypothetical protein